MYYMDMKEYNEGIGHGQAPAVKEQTILSAVDTVVVHGGTYHADDALTVALCQIWRPDIQVVRENDPDAISAHRQRPQSLVADIGRGDFDHHQENAARRPDGERHAACGLVFDAIRDQLPLTADQKSTLEHVIPMIEDADNTGRMSGKGMAYNDVTATINATRPTFLESQAAGSSAISNGFDVAVSLLHGLIAFGSGVVSDPKRTRNTSLLSLLKDVNPDGAQRMLDYADSRITARDESDAAMRDVLTGAMDAYNTARTGIVVLDEPMPWMRIAAIDNLRQLRVGIMPDERSGGWLVTSAKTRDGNNWLPCPSFVETGRDGCTFIHSSRFMAVFETKEEAIRMAERMVANERADIAKVTRDPSSIAHMQNPSIETCKAAVRADPECRTLVPIRDREIDEAAEEAESELAAKDPEPLTFSIEQLIGKALNELPETDMVAGSNTRDAVIASGHQHTHVDKVQNVSSAGYIAAPQAVTSETGSADNETKAMGDPSARVDANDSSAGLLDIKDNNNWDGNGSVEATVQALEDDEIDNDGTQDPVA